MAPLSWPQLRPTPPVPAVIRGLYEPGKINVVEFADFQCPHCRDLHGRLKQAVLEYGDRVHFQRRHVPLPMHPQAHEAARAAICAEHQNRGEAMADHLFEAENLSAPENRRAAQQLGLDLEAFDECLVHPATDQRIAQDIDLLREAGFEGLPTTYVGGQRILGAASSEVFRDALATVAREEDRTGVPSWAFALACLLALGAILYAGRVRPPRGPE